MYERVIKPRFLDDPYRRSIVYHVALDMGQQMMTYKKYRILHLDIKLSNMLIAWALGLPTARGGNWTAKGSDHGTVRRLDHGCETVPTGGEGTPGYRSPEAEGLDAVLSCYAGKDSDSYAAGGVIYTLCHHTSLDQELAAQCAFTTELLCPA